MVRAAASMIGSAARRLYYSYITGKHKKETRTSKKFLHAFINNSNEVIFALILVSVEFKSSSIPLNCYIRGFQYFTFPFRLYSLYWSGLGNISRQIGPFGSKNPTKDESAVPWEKFDISGQEQYRNRAFLADLPKHSVTASPECLCSICEVHSRCF